MFEKEKGLRICKTIHTIFVGPWEFLLIDEKVYLVSQYHVKNCSEICHIFFQQTIFYSFFMNFDGFFLYKKLKIYKDSYYSFFKDQMLLNMS